MFNKKQEKNVIKNSFTNKSEAFENKVYFNLKKKLFDLRQKKKKEISLKKS
jgi:hypothetical protein